MPTRVLSLSAAGLVGSGGPQSTPTFRLVFLWLSLCTRHVAVPSQPAEDISQECAQGCLCQEASPWPCSPPSSLPAAPGLPGLCGAYQVPRHSWASVLSAWNPWRMLPPPSPGTSSPHPSPAGAPHPTQGPRVPGVLGVGNPTVPLVWLWNFRLWVYLNLDLALPSA